MKEKILEIIGNSLDKLNVYVYDVVYEKEGGFNYLRIILDSNDIIDMNKVVEASSNAVSTAAEKIANVVK